MIGKRESLSKNHAESEYRNRPDCLFIALYGICIFLQHIVRIFDGSAIRRNPKTHQFALNGFCYSWTSMCSLLCSYILYKSHYIITSFFCLPQIFEYMYVCMYIVNSVYLHTDMDTDTDIYACKLAYRHTGIFVN